MAITTSGSIVFQVGEAQATMHVPIAKSAEALKAFALALADYTEASIVSCSFSYEEELSVAGGELQALETKGKCLFHGEPGKTKSKNFAIPAPKQDLFEIVSGQGLLMTKTKGMELAALYSTLTGETFRFIRGRVS